MTELDIEQIDDIGRLVEVIDLVGIEKFEERGRRVVREDEEIRQVNSLGVVRRFPEGLLIRVRAVVGFGDAEYVADIAANYEFDHGAHVSDDVITEFVERVGFFAVYPFLRESIFSSATRMGRPAPVMGVVRAGEFTFEGEMSDAEVQREFFDNKSEIPAGDS